MERSRDWMTQADRDLRQARASLDEELYEWSCFAAQQAAAKAVKAVFSRLGAEVRGHGIADMLEELVPRYGAARRLVPSARRLDKLYIPTRYPDCRPARRAMRSPGRRRPGAFAMRIESRGSVTIYWPDFTRDELIERLRSFIPALRAALPVRHAVLFGSWAANRATVSSDVDLMVIYDDPKHPRDWFIVRETVDLKGLEPHVYCASDARKLAPTLNRMMRGGVDLLAPPDAPPVGDQLLAVAGAAG